MTYQGMDKSFTLGTYLNARLATVAMNRV